ncbi:MAG: Xaa-Pro peptidase family protein [Candidatus Woesearchaeota archaeon]
MKIKEFQNKLLKKKIDFALFYNFDFSRTDPNFQYFSGYKDIGILVIPSKKKPFILIPAMDDQRFKSNKIKKHLFEKKRKAFDSINRILNKERVRKKIIGIDKSQVTLRMHKAIKYIFKKSNIVDISLESERLRGTKTKEEIKNIRKACQITDKIISKCIKSIINKKIKTEKQAEKFLEIETLKNDCELSFPSIVASGKMASIPHYKPQNVKFRKGFCVIDFGVSYQGYKADITRTIYIGKPSKKEIELYALLLNCQKNVIDNIRKGDNCGKVYENSIKLLGDLKDKFIHGLGHGIGLKIHESPSLVLDSKDKLDEGSVFTIEPGIYFKNKMGMRIEDDVAIINGKVQVLTKTKKELIVAN